MPVKQGREYRSIDIMNFEAKDDNDYIVEGYATTFNEPYELLPGYYEQISERALDGADMSDVIFQLNHSGMVMARMRNNTLSLLPDEHGLYVRASLKGSADGRNLYEGIKNGLIDRMSWGFTIEDDGWQYDEATSTATINRVRKIYDVSAVSIPANEGTEIKARSYLDGVIEREQQELLSREKERARVSLACARLRLSR